MALRILIADDTSAHAKVMRFSLVAAGYDVTITGDGREAWMAAQREQFDIVITDYKMPQMTGIMLCQLLRQDRRYAETPLILVSSFCRELDVELLQTRFYLSAVREKPIAAADLVKTVEECLATGVTAV